MIFAVTIESGNLILLAIAAVITAATPGFLAWLQGRKIHTIVNSQRTAMEASIKALEEESKKSAARAAEAVAEKRMAEITAANQTTLREAVAEAVRLAVAGIGSRPLPPAPAAAIPAPEAQTIVTEKIVANKIVTPEGAELLKPKGR